MTKICLLFASLAFVLGAQDRTKLLVVSVDGLDSRYLTDRDKLRLRIPHLRKLLAEGQVAAGVLGVVPTITWPSHTTMITGVDPSVHGIRGNRRPASEGGDYPWSASLLKAGTLLDAAHDAGRKTASITWPVTVDAPVDFNLPEYFRRRRGGAMDLPSIGSKAQPKDLVDRITAMFPSFPQEWMDDRTRTQAVVYLLKTEKPDLTLVHLVDLDSEEHDNGPFSREAIGILEYTDELIGQMMAALPRGYALALVSDHGFEAVTKAVNLKALAAQRQVEGVEVSGTLVSAKTPAASAFLQELSKDSQSGVGRQIPKEEVARLAPEMSRFDSVFEPAPGVEFSAGASAKETATKPREKGNHGYWPTRYRAVYMLWGAGVKKGALPEISMKDVAGRLASVMGLTFSPGPKPRP